ncbi:sigma-54-dependent Fis family transcriptional regulator [Pseudoalteromonas rubra]|uniref:Sigma-54-dependent Fis family transcriptional regulator n=1 Tax=Pseudoalteromonas rubra TaxID=43658 RepID=A0A4Q7E0T1_9GAMM|nr:sigma-54 dependent transcriptional regulator [Pseudoalteromonas rubra]RZM74824.1 sigma-54-dependent Fis family transcriptional regulator [Pseudoalteromonas rubra]
MNKILVVDDNQAVLDALSLLLELHDYQVETALTPFEALQIVRYQRIALVIQDMNFTADTTSGEEGKALFRELRAINPHLPVILITAWTELEMAIELVKAGAADYLAKPWDDQKLLTSVANLIALGEAKTQNEQYERVAQQRETLNEGADLRGLIYRSAAMQRVVDMAVQVARSDVSVLITGDNGSGKEKVAEIIQANSTLKAAPFIKVNAGALPQELIEAELFGAEAGAYTGANRQRIGRFEAADGGTLFLDEIGNLPLSGQMKLLRVLQTGEFERLGSVETRRVNVRVISATNADLLSDIQSGRFRQDLYYRLNVIELNLPPLKSRSDDILPLIAHFLPGRELSLSAEQRLLSYDWPGNVRELENACKRAAVLNPQGLLEAQDFGLHQGAQRSEQPAQSKQEPGKAELEGAMREFHGVIAKVARHFGMSRQALYRRLQKHDIDY